MNLPEVTKKNYKKIIRELDLAQFPSFNHNAYLKDIREKLINKKQLLFSEEKISFFKLKNYFIELKREANKYSLSKFDLSRFNKRPPLPFQEVGIKFLVGTDNVILADDTGIGKSVQSVIAALSLPENYKILIVTLKTLKYNFQNEIAYYSDSYKVIEDKWEVGYKFTIIHYEAVKKFKKEILKEKFECIIADESHVLNNTKTIRTSNFTDIVTAKDKNLKKLWLLTGTPITNRPANYFNLLKLIKHPLGSNWFNFVTRYCDGHQDFYGKWQIGGSSNLTELYEQTKGSILRRLKKEYLKDLPNKNRTPLFLKLDNWNGYKKAITDYEENKLKDVLSDVDLGKDMLEYFLENGVQANAMTKLILWRQFCALEKIRDGSLVDLIENQVDQDNKIVVFTNFTSVIDAVHGHFTEKKCRLLDGRIKDSKERLAIVDEFNRDENLKVFVLNYQVGGVGLNVPSANIFIANDMSWVPGVMLQGEDRIWRIGQEREVNALYPLYKGTVEEIMFNVIQEKMKNITTAIEGKESEFFETNEYKEKITNERDSILKQIFAQMAV